MPNSPFPPECDNSPVVATLICLLVDLGRERNSAHDAISKLLVHDSLVRTSVRLHNFIQPINQRVLWWHLGPMPSIWETTHGRPQWVEIQFQQRG